MTDPEKTRAAEERIAAAVSSGAVDLDGIKTRRDAERFIDQLVEIARVG
jgi:hypothetical protein